jgi:hypothetical protein
VRSSFALRVSAFFYWLLSSYGFVTASVQDWLVRHRLLSLGLPFDQNGFDVTLKLLCAMTYGYNGLVDDFVHVQRD